MLSWFPYYPFVMRSNSYAVSSRVASQAAAIVIASALVLPAQAADELPVDAAQEAALIRAAGREFHIKRTPHFLVVPHLLLKTPLIATLHGRPARWLAAAFKLRTSLLPIDIASFPESMVWHEVVDRDPAQVWLRDMISEVAIRFSAW